MCGERTSLNVSTASFETMEREERTVVDDASDEFFSDDEERENSDDVSIATAWSDTRVAIDYVEKLYANAAPPSVSKIPIVLISQMYVQMPLYRRFTHT